MRPPETARYRARVPSSVPRHLLAVDTVFAAALLLLGEAALLTNGTALPAAVGAALTAAYTAPLAVRRLAPVTVCVTAYAAVLAIGLLDPAGRQPSIPFALALAAYSLARYAAEPWTWIIMVPALGAMWAAILATGGPAGDVVVATIIYGAPWAFGLALRARQQRAAALATQAVTAERARIARELHDIVAHSLSVVTLQTQAVRRRLHADQGRETGDLQAVEQTAREALVEMRRLLGVLRAGDHTAPLAPQPSLAHLDGLLAEARRAGLTVGATVTGDPRPLPPGVDLAGFRIVQEALTNVRRHARASTSAVRLHYTPTHLDIEIDDDGAGPATHTGVGNGLIGMRERVHLYDGELTTGAGPDGGYRVHARLPLGGTA
jgi:signal transduction histidine kinase